MRSLAILLLPAAGVVLTAQVDAESHAYRYLMGTSVEVQAFGGDVDMRRAAIDEAFAVFAEVDRLMSNYRDDSELALVNRVASREAVAVSDPMFSVLEAARRIGTASSGAFKDPDAPGRVMGVVETGESSVSTSSDSYNVLVANGRRYGHVLDPRTLEPATSALSATVFSRDGTLADAMSKAAFILGPKAGLALVESFPGISAVIAYRKADGAVAVAVSPRLAGAYRPTARR